jgi:membrane-bound lytic murein transglycosylase D
MIKAVRSKNRWWGGEPGVRPAVRCFLLGALYGGALTGCAVLPERSALLPERSAVGESSTGAVAAVVLGDGNDPFSAALRAATTPEVPRLPEPPLELRPEVERQVRDFVRGRRFIERSLLRREEYLPLIREIFAEEGVPEDLMNVALIESGFNPEARSYAGAVGMWQFMKTTGRAYGLAISKKVDERRNVAVSTVAAARHLRDLYGIFGDWYLALAAYNAGVGGVTRAMKRAGSEDFWVVARKGKLKRQTVEYVPRFIAVTLIVNDLEAHGFGQLAANLESMRLAQNGIVPPSAGSANEDARAAYRAR